MKLVFIKKSSFSLVLSSKAPTCVKLSFIEYYKIYKKKLNVDLKKVLIPMKCSRCIGIEGRRKEAEEKFVLLRKKTSHIVKKAIIRSYSY